MATAEAQRKWRDKNRDVKTQLNVMARKATHDQLMEIAAQYGLRGKAEAVEFAVFVTNAMQHKGQGDAATYLYLDALKAGFKRARNVFFP